MAIEIEEVAKQEIDCAYIEDRNTIANRISRRGGEEIRRIRTRSRIEGEG